MEEGEREGECVKGGGQDKLHAGVLVCVTGLGGVEVEEDV